MKLKYYLRGAGIGILISTIVLMIAFSVKGNNLTDEQIKAKAKKLGMVESQDAEVIADSKVKQKEKNNSNDESNPEEVVNDNINDDNYNLVISKGEVPRTVINRLIDEGIVKDYDEFARILHNKGYDHDILPGNYVIPRDSSYEDIAEILRPNK